MDLIGEAGPLADAELMAAAVDIMRAFGLGPDGRAGSGSPTAACCGRCCSGRGVTEAQLPVAYAAIDKSERDPHDVIAQRLTQGGLTDKARDGVFQVAGLQGAERRERRAGGGRRRPTRASRCARRWARSRRWVWASSSRSI